MTSRRSLFAVASVVVVAAWGCTSFGAAPSTDGGRSDEPGDGGAGEGGASPREGGSEGGGSERDGSCSFVDLTTELGSSHDWQNFGTAKVDGGVMELTPDVAQSAGAIWGPVLRRGSALRVTVGYKVTTAAGGGPIGEGLAVSFVKDGTAQVSQANTYGVCSNANLVGTTFAVDTSKNDLRAITPSCDDVETKAADLIGARTLVVEIESEKATATAGATTVTRDEAMPDEGRLVLSARTRDSERARHVITSLRIERCD